MTNWVFDWEYHKETGVNTCPKDSKCLSFENRYKNGEGLCNNMWGNSFKYSDEAYRLCLTPGENKNNKAVISQMFGEKCKKESEEESESEDGGGRKGMETGSAIGLGLGIGFVIGALIGGALLHWWVTEKFKRRGVKMDTHGDNEEL